MTDTGRTKTGTVSVYIIECEGRVKIGIAADVAKRLRGLDFAMPHDCRLITSRPFPTRDYAGQVERRLHRQFADRRLKGEWFTIGVDEAQVALAAEPEMVVPPPPPPRATPFVEFDSTDVALAYLESVVKGKPMSPEMAAARRRILRRLDAAFPTPPLTGET